MYYFPSTWRRLLAHFTDKALIMCLQAPVWISIAMYYIRNEQLRVHWAHLAYMVLVSLLYETVCLAVFSATIGKWQWGLRVISRESGSSKRLAFDQALVRTLVTRFSFFFGWSVFAVAFFRSNRTHFADWVANTQVVGVKERKQRPKVRWILALGFIFLSLNESIRTAAITINSTQWRDPFVYFDSEKIRQIMQDIQLTIESQNDE